MGTHTQDPFVWYMKSSWEVTLAHFSIEKIGEREEIRESSDILEKNRRVDFTLSMGMLMW
jgi:hypothetical protein